MLGERPWIRGSEYSFHWKIEGYKIRQLGSIADSAQTRSNQQWRLWQVLNLGCSEPLLLALSPSEGLVEHTMLSDHNDHWFVEGFVTYTLTWSLTSFWIKSPCLILEKLSVIIFFFHTKLLGKDKLVQLYVQVIAKVYTAFYDSVSH